MRRLSDFSEIIVVDAEYCSTPGKLEVHCLCARELRSGREHRLWWDELVRLKAPPYPHGPDALFVSYNAPAELSVYLELGWPMPPHILDLLIEYRQHVNGVVDKHLPRRLLNALRYFDLPAMEESKKDYWHKVAIAGQFDAELKAGLIAYCMEDVEAEISLFQALEPRLPGNLEYALLRGRYTVAVADMERRGIPADQETWEQILADRETIQLVVAKWMNRVYPLYEGTTFKHKAFEVWLQELGLSHCWPRTERAGRLATDRDAFRKFASRYPQIERLRQVRAVLEQLSRPSFEITGGRNFYGILPFLAESGRNSTVGCLFTAPRWLRALIQPNPDTVLIYADYESEELAIAGALSGDDAVLHAYATGDPYVFYGIQAGLIPVGGTKQTHPTERELAKTLMLAAQYGQTKYGLATRMGVSRSRAAEMLAKHQRDFRKLWEWSNQTVSMARWNGWISTEHGWRLAVGEGTKERTLRNFRLQGTGGDILRLASLLLWENGLEVCCPVHDAFLLQVSNRHASLEDAVRITRHCMEKAGEYILRGHKLRVEMRVLRYPERLLDGRGQVMWDLVQTIKSRLSAVA